MCHADLHPKTNIQYEFHENWKNTDEAVLPWSILPYILPIICRYHGNVLFATAEICVLHINIFRWTSVPNFIKIDQKLWEEFAMQDLYPFLPIIYRYHGNVLLGTVENTSCTSTTQGTHLCQVLWESVENWGSSSRRKICNGPTARPTARLTGRPTVRWFLYTPFKLRLAGV